jgi:hypothetical protein
VRLAGSLLTSYADNSDSYALSTTAAFLGQALTDVAGRNTPATYGNQAASDYNAAGGDFLGALGVANRYNPTLSFYNAFSGIDAINGSQLSGVQQGQAWLNSAASLALLGTGFVESPTPGSVPPVLSTTPAAAPTSVFWSGFDSDVAAQTWAANNGGQTLSTSPFAIGANATRAEAQSASTSFAQSASGNVQVFQPAVGVPVNGIWAQFEYPALLQNPNVSGITYQIFDTSGNVIHTVTTPTR